MNLTLGSVVPLAMFNFNLKQHFYMFFQFKKPLVHFVIENGEKLLEYHSVSLVTVVLYAVPVLRVTYVGLAVCRLPFHLDQLL